MHYRDVQIAAVIIGVIFVALSFNFSYSTLLA